LVPPPTHYTEIWTSSVTGADFRRIGVQQDEMPYESTTAFSIARNFRWLPDGKRLSFTVDTDGGSLYTIPAD
jgi:hypothetical protein